MYTATFYVRVFKYSIKYSIEYSHRKLLVNSSPKRANKATANQLRVSPGRDEQVLTMSTTFGELHEERKWLSQLAVPVKIV